VRILVVEDEPKLAVAVKSGLENDGYEVDMAGTGEEGFFLIHSQSFDLIVLDVMLPGRSGFEVLATLRRHGNKTPVLLLTAKDAIEDRVRGLDAGADDYLVKPFAFPELLARIRALLRRGKPDLPGMLIVSDLTVDFASRSAIRGDRRIDLTTREFELLCYLIQNVGRVVSREMLARDVWKEKDRHTPLDNVIDVHIGRLRRKIDEPFPKNLIHTVRGVGFMIRDEIP
jgi:two-component system, OmpR family, copper resistance phosphate regulon response regulator CusR